MNYGFIIDNRKCIGCHACTVACKSEHDVPVGVNRTWVKYIEKGEYPNTRRLFSVMRCNHCADAPCVDICPVEALHTRDDGIVDFDNRRCIGCKACMQACPYDALYIDPETQTAAKCNYCSHRVDIGLEPACVVVCPEHAIISGDMDNPASEISTLLAREQVVARKVEKGTEPNLFYIDGDEASLTPTATSVSENYMWNSQASGVGHFARYAESLVAKSDPVEMAKQLSGKDSSTASETAGAGTNPDSGIVGLLKEKTRRVYDAPDKGILWGWEVSAYVWTKAIAAGAWLLVVLLDLLTQIQLSDTILWTGWGVSLLFLGITGLLLVKDLDRPDRFLYVLLRPQWGSWLTRGGYAITIYGALLSLWALLKSTEAYFLPIDLVGLAAGVFALITAVYTAFLFAQAKGRDFWQSPTLSLHMIVHAVMAGACAFAIAAMFDAAFAGLSSILGIVLIASIVLNLLIIAAELITTHPTADARKVVGMIVSGRFKISFWLGTVVLGNLVPLVLIWLGGTELMAAASVLCLIGIYITEHIWVRAPQLLPLS